MKKKDDESWYEMRIESNVMDVLGKLCKWFKRQVQERKFSTMFEQDIHRVFRLWVTTLKQMPLT